MKFPDKVRIGAFDHDVTLVKNIDSQGNIGKLTQYKRRILVEKKMPESTKFETLWHECVHGLMHQAGHIEHEESLVMQLTFGICQVLRDNPYLRGQHLFDPLLQAIREANSDYLPETFEEVGTFTEKDNGK